MPQRSIADWFQQEIKKTISVRKPSYFLDGNNLILKLYKATGSYEKKFKRYGI